jgi:flagellar basal-body rod protein FlgG
LDVAIEGDGFFQVQDPSGEILYSRAGNFNINANGQLVMGSASTGRFLEPAIQFPQDTVGIVIGADGKVTVRTAGTSAMQEVGQFQLAQFVNPDGLIKLGENLYAQSDASNTPTIGIPGQDGLGQLRQGMLEASNVQPVRELIDLITTQRSFELNSQTVQAGDQVLQLVANLRRY